MRLSTWMVLGIATVAVGMAGCGGGQEEAQYPQQQQYQQQPYGQGQSTYGQPNTYGQQQPNTYGQQPQAQTPAQQQPPPQQTPPQGQQGGQAAPLDAAAGSVVQPILNELAKQQAPAGAKPVGSTMVGNFQQGQTLENQLQLQPGKCYTVVAAAMPPVTEVNVKFVAVAIIPGSTGMVMAQDNETGTQGVLGEKPNCYKNPAPMAIPVRVVLEVAGGQGLAAAQVYEK